MGRKLALILTVASMVVAAPTTASAAAGALVAPPAACPSQTRLDAPARVQEAAMLCMTDFARGRAGESELMEAAELDLSADDKSGDILSCDSFSHSACGREFTYWMRQTGYLTSPCWRAGENLAWGTGAYGTVRSIFRAWMLSPDHRANILGDFDQIGIDLKIGTLDGQPGTRVWTQHFGSHCEAPPAQG